MQITTAKVREDDMEWARSCMEKTNTKSFAKFFHKIHIAVVEQNRKTFYNSLPIVGKKQPLKGKRVRKKGIHNK